MLVHLDASTHEWVAGLPLQDLVVALDDADGRILYARFFPQEGTASTFAALESVLRNYGRFAELYTDRGSHFCHSERSGEVVDGQHGQVSQALRALGIRQILALSPRVSPTGLIGRIQGNDRRDIDRTLSISSAVSHSPSVPILRKARPLCTWGSHPSTMRCNN
jgi:hypothetical protein